MDSTLFPGEYEEDQVVYEGNTIRMLCQSKNGLVNKCGDWKVCRWDRVSDGADCQYKYKKMKDTKLWEVQKTCHPSMEDSTFFGSNTSAQGHGNNRCGINIHNATRYDSSSWKLHDTYTCKLHQCTHDCTNTTGKTAEAKINVTVMI